MPAAPFSEVDRRGLLPRAAGFVGIALVSDCSSALFFYQRPLNMTRKNLQLELARILTSRQSGVRAPKFIFDDSPSNWRDLQNEVRQVFSECGCEAVSEKAVVTVRGKVNIDVVVQDNTRGEATPPRRR